MLWLRTLHKEKAPELPLLINQHDSGCTGTLLERGRERPCVCGGHKGVLVGWGVGVGREGWEVGGDIFIKMLLLLFLLVPPYVWGTRGCEIGVGRVGISR